jgi:hypothetical protein
MPTLNVKQLWVIFLNKNADDAEALEMMPDIDNLETVRVKGELGLPVFTARQKADEYIQNEKCLRAVPVCMEGVVRVAGFLQGLIGWKRLGYVVIDPTEAKTFGSAVIAKRLYDDIIAELDKHKP